MSVENRVAHHFENDATRFDAIYRESGKNWFSRFVDNRWRGVVQRRLELAVTELAPLKGKSIFDVGCGSGRYCHAFAAGGASRVLGRAAIRKQKLVRRRLPLGSRFIRRSIARLPATKTLRLSRR